jgi:1-aminocyclopropane-1-carboxylate deaminase/D-cysteine desulfhydrase-like pyridoxal-dependent ACC family enzyme
MTLPGGREVWQLIKRDDLTAPIYGGNKVRKLEFLLADARAKGARRIVTAGALGSHHALATTVHGRRMGFDVTVVLFPQRISPHVRNIVLMLNGLGADVRFTRRMEMVPLALARLRRSFGSDAYVVAPGGSDATGTLGYVECGLELAKQIAVCDVGNVATRIHVAAGTMGTVAGLATGLHLAGVEMDIAATRITSPLVTNERAMLKLIRGALSRIGQDKKSARTIAQRVTLVHDQIGDGYGKSTGASEEAARLFDRSGIELDATYTAKSAAALLADPLTEQGRTIFLHTLSAAEPIEQIGNADMATLPREIVMLLERFTDVA